MIMKTYKLTLALFLYLSVLVTATATSAAQNPPPKDDPFAELDQAMESLQYEGSKAEYSEFEQWKQAYLNDYQKFRQEHFKKVDDIRDNLIDSWGSAEVSSPKELVEYSKDKNIKTVLDFDKNEIRISIIHKEGQVVKPVDILKALHTQASKDQTLSQLLGKKIDDALVQELLVNADKKQYPAIDPLKRKSVLNQEIQVIKQQASAQKNQIERVIDQLNMANKAQLASKELAQIQQKSEQDRIEATISKQKAQIEKEMLQRIALLQSQTAKLNNNKAKKEALKSKKITTYTMPLAHRNNLTKARPYISQVKTQSARWQLSPSLILAIMHTESYFNPKAQSHIPAFGLMQIVPRSAGIDANRLLNKKDAPMTQADLFIPDYNITAGVAYMHILNSRYLRKITNPQSRLYCMIAAYNTGSGNVAKTFNKDKSRNINRAAIIINKLTPAEVYQHLVNHLPYEETKHYVQRVVKRQDIYAPVESL